MFRFGVMWAWLIVFVMIGELYGQVSDIAVEPYVASIDQVSGEVTRYGQKIVLRHYDVELEERIQQIPIFTIQFNGYHHLEKAGKDQFEARAKCIAERLEVALDLLGKDGSLIIKPDDWQNWRLKGDTSPGYPPAPQTCPAIYIQHQNLDKPLRIMTIYPEDLLRFPRHIEEKQDAEIENEEDLAKYIVDLIRAHHTLFFEQANDIDAYQNIDIDKTREGKIFKEIFIRAKEIADLWELDEINTKAIKDALARIAMPQRQRLVLLSVIAPRDWK